MDFRKATTEERTLNEVALKKILAAYPTLTKDEVGEFLVECTAFPFSSVIESMNQALKYAEASAGNHEKAIQLSNDEFARAWEAGLLERERLDKEEEARQQSEVEKFVKIAKERKRKNENI